MNLLVLVIYISKLYPPNIIITIDIHFTMNSNINAYNNNVIKLIYYAIHK